MKTLTRLFVTQSKLYLREPLATFFTIFFAPLMLLLFGAIYGNDPSPYFGGYGTVDVSVPAYIGLIIVTVGLISLPVENASSRERGILRRYKATPLRPATYLAAYVLVYFFMTLLGIALLVLTGILVYQVRFDGNVFAVFLGFVLSTVSFLGFGFLLASVAPTARFAQTVGMVLAYPMMFISGATIPLEVMPESVRAVANYVPLTYVVKLMRGLWRGEPWGNHLLEVGVLLGLLILEVVLASRFFRWE